MTETTVAVDCGSGETVQRPLTDREAAGRDALQQAAAAARADLDAKTTAQALARGQIKQLAKQGKPVDAGTLAAALGIDINAPDPSTPAPG